MTTSIEPWHIGPVVAAPNLTGLYDHNAYLIATFTYLADADKVLQLIDKVRTLHQEVDELNISNEDLQDQLEKLEEKQTKLRNKIQELAEMAGVQF